MSYIGGMCLTVPRLVKKIEGKRALMQDGRWVNTVMVKRVKPGDLLMVQADLAIEKISNKQGKMMKEIMLNDSQKENADDK